jgi:hypothetical protein
MKIPDLDLTPTQFQNDPEATRDMAIMIAKLTDILRDIYGNLQTLPVVSSAPVITQMQETGNPDGTIKSDIKVLDSGTQTSRRIYYRYQSNLRYVESD